MRFLHRTLLAIGFAFVASSITAAAAATADDACKISKTIVAAAIGLPVLRTTPSASGSLSGCSFHSARMVHSATILTSRQDSVDAAKSYFAQELAETASLSQAKPTRVPGIGDEAAEVAGLLYVRKGTALYDFTVVDGSPQPQPLAEAIKIAKAVMPAVRP